MQQMIEAGFTPAHAGTLEPLLNEPLASAFHETAADRPSLGLESWIVEMILMRFEIALEIRKGLNSGLRQGFRSEPLFDLGPYLYGVTVAQRMAPALRQREKITCTFFSRTSTPSLQS
jgi:hypothetical protein